MNKHIRVTKDVAEPQKVPVRRRNPQGIPTESISITIPKTLHQTINGIAVETTKSRSLIITQLIEAGLKETKQ